jgi:hypothetical protein
MLIPPSLGRRCRYNGRRRLAILLTLSALMFPLLVPMTAWMILKGVLHMRGVAGQARDMSWLDADLAAGVEAGGQPPRLQQQQEAAAAVEAEAGAPLDQQDAAAAPASGGGGQQPAFAREAASLGGEAAGGAGASGAGAAEGQRQLGQRRLTARRSSLEHAMRMTSLREHEGIVAAPAEVHDAQVGGRGRPRWGQARRGALRTGLLGGHAAAWLLLGSAHSRCYPELVGCPALPPPLPAARCRRAWSAT